MERAGCGQEAKQKYEKRRNNGDEVIGREE
jgi:hypothetical protein